MNRRPIGLKRDSVRLSAYNPEWSGAFEIQAADIRRALGHLAADVQHVGSTAVPGLPAKPILDIAVAVTSHENVPEAARRLSAAGFIDRGAARAGDGGYLLVKDREPNVRLSHVHIVELADPQWRGYLDFRDALRANARLRDEYAELKRSLAERYPTDREGYTAGKREFIQRATRMPE